MRAWLLGLGLPLVLTLACSGRSVGSGGHETSQQVESSLPSWCQSTCRMLASCEVEQDCACTTEPCDCVSNVGPVSECSEDCQESLGERARISDACAQEIARFKRCVDARGCSVLDNSGVCPMARTGVCEDDGGDIANPPPSGGVVIGTGGTYNSDPGSSAPQPPIGTSGTASIPAGPGMPAVGGGPGAPPLPGPVVHCNSGTGSAGGGPPPSGAQVICEEGHELCSDGSRYFTICVMTTGRQSSCSCFVNEQLTTAFDPGGTCPTLAQINAGCGWNLQ